MVNPEIQTELDKIEKLIPNLERFWDLKLMNVPEIFRKELNLIKVIPQFTSSGVESVLTVLNTLYFARYMAQKELKQEPEVLQSAEEKMTTETVKPATVVKPTPTPTIPPKVVSPSPQKVDEKYKTEKPLDFGPFEK